MHKVYREPMVHKALRVPRVKREPMAQMDKMVYKV